MKTFRHKFPHNRQRSPPLPTALWSSERASGPNASRRRRLARSTALAPRGPIRFRRRLNSSSGPGEALLDTSHLRPPRAERAGSAVRSTSAGSETTTLTGGVAKLFRCPRAAHEQECWLRRSSQEHAVWWSARSKRLNVRVVGRLGRCLLCLG